MLARACRRSRDAFVLSCVKNMAELSGCSVLQQLWSIAAKDLDLEHPGIGGLPSRLVSFVEIHNMPTFLQLAAIKCWEERSRGGAFPGVQTPPLFHPGPRDVQHAQRASSKSSSGSTSTSSVPSQSKQ